MSGAPRRLYTFVFFPLGRSSLFVYLLPYTEFFSCRCTPSKCQIRRPEARRGTPTALSKAVISRTQTGAAGVLLGAK
ncbi:hypothetical protein PICMEDRAFT_121151 [Pichia membranifaciens NRRL Y-2026]|uniref:Uncharacterized protein n=1 Tax=Pichia membranifaciens NRRL Y-2026 TaxID=763406 RepID=A0A1E3NP89_9ASCO|nr:hypothetical protein PICMEDRAFT_121151 [Pichia membranifaciens NRRL Y-2026]ODQ47914.1 hypothetical protein PICMEDRAFT_121151 [Pichia membranifaciens NRRL Y-2026]